VAKKCQDKSSSKPHSWNIQYKNVQHCITLYNSVWLYNRFDSISINSLKKQASLYCGGILVH
jgi:hypothetical protein